MDVFEPYEVWYDDQEPEPQKTSPIIKIEPMKGYDIVDVAIDALDIFKRSPLAVVTCRLYGVVFTLTASTSIDDLINQYTITFYKSKEEARKARIFFIHRKQHYLKATKNPDTFVPRTEIIH